MSDPFLVFGESAYLTMLARRVLNYARDAEARGETYVNMTPFTRLNCGAMARLTFTPTTTGYTPVVEVKYHRSAGNPEDALAIANEIASTEMVLSKYSPEMGYTFTRKTP